MAINFPSNPSDGDTHAGFTYSSSVGAWESTASTPVTQATLDGYLQVANSSSGTTVYSAISDLPLSGNESGAQAYVSGTNRLYLWTGSGWYNIALINTNPSLSGASATYNLNTDGSNTVVTLASTDPEGIPITFTASHSGLGVGANAIATVTQSNNIFTFTPTTNTSLAGTFTTTFTASDGVNLAVANSSFTLAFRVNNSNYTTALITSVGANNAVNNSFVDASPSSTSLTAYQDAHMTSFSPYRQGGYSTYFDGSGDRLSNTSPGSSLDISSGDFTIEGWFNPASSGSTQTLIQMFTATNANYVGLTVSIARLSNGTITAEGGSASVGGGAAAFSITSSDTVENNSWSHIALTRNGNTFTLWINGVSNGTSSFSGTLYWSPPNLYIGSGNNSAPNYYPGYITDVRIIKGTAVYTSAFTPPTERLTAITNTSLLACHLPYIADGSTNGHTLGVSGDVATRPFSPYDVDEYIAATDGGSVRISSSGDYVGFQNGTDFEFDGDFTVACWVYFESETGHNSIFSISDTGNDGFCQMGSDRLLLRNTAGTTTIIDDSSYQIPANRWTHVALTRSGSDIKFFLNGVITLTATSSVTISEVSSVEGTIGRRLNSANIGYFFGNIADLYVKKGTADYTAAFTPPLTPASSTGTVLHVKGTDAGIIDKSQSVKTLTLNGDAKSSTTQTKYLSSSMAFDGTGDYLYLPDYTPQGTEDFTFEAWIYAETASDSPIWESRPDGTDTSGFTVTAYSSTVIRVWTSAALVSATVSNYLNSWTHVAYTRSGSTNRLFINGNLEATATASDNFTNADALIGGGRYGAGSTVTNYFDGYMSDVRITKGLARYTANFTPPTAALQG